MLSKYILLTEERSTFLKFCFKLYCDHNLSCLRTLSPSQRIKPMGGGGSPIVKVQGEARLYFL